MDIDCNCREILRYLGVAGKVADGRLLAGIRTGWSELNAAATPRSQSREFPLSFWENGVRLGDFSIESADLRRHLRGCRRAVLFAATLGPGVDFLLTRAQKMDMSRAVVLQACAAAMTENWCDASEAPIKERAAVRGLHLRARYSPGYGDFPVRYQRPILRILDSQKRIGLSVTGSSMLVPIKSVTAVIGLADEASECHVAKCMDCTLPCAFRKKV